MILAPVAAPVPKNCVRPFESAREGMEEKKRRLNSVRAALEQGDLAECNPCLSLLQQLYADNVSLYSLIAGHWLLNFHWHPSSATDFLPDNVLTCCSCTISMASWKAVHKRWEKGMSIDVAFSNVMARGRISSKWQSGSCLHGVMHELCGKSKKVVAIVGMRRLRAMRWSSWRTGCFMPR